jgi:hypothetical protein
MAVIPPNDSKFWRFAYVCLFTVVIMFLTVFITWMQVNQYDMKEFVQNAGTVAAFLGTLKFASLVKDLFSPAEDKEEPPESE